MISKELGWGNGTLIQLTIKKDDIISDKLDCVN